MLVAKPIGRAPAPTPVPEVAATDVRSRRRSHDPALLAFLRDQHAPLTRFLTLYVGDRQLAEDLAQETLARVVGQWTKVRDLDAPHLWTRRVAMNLANSQFRRRAAANRALVRLESRARSGPTEAADGAAAVAIRQAVAALPAQMRTAVVLRYFEDLSVAEVAAFMRCPEGTVKALTSRAVARLRTAGLVAEEPTR
jgi:RNA polymerase sigma factor (sigma-70 family)